MRQVIDAGQQVAKILIIGNTADRRTANADTVIAAFTPDQPGPAGITA